VGRSGVVAASHDDQKGITSVLNVPRSLDYPTIVLDMFDQDTGRSLPERYSTSILRQITKFYDEPLLIQSTVALDEGSGPLPFLVRSAQTTDHALSIHYARKVMSKLYQQWPLIPPKIRTPEIFGLNHILRMGTFQFLKLLRLSVATHVTDLLFEGNEASGAWCNWDFGFDSTRDHAGGGGTSAIYRSGACSGVLGILCTRLACALREEQQNAHVKPPQSYQLLTTLVDDILSNFEAFAQGKSTCSQIVSDQKSLSVAETDIRLKHPQNFAVEEEKEEIDQLETKESEPEDLSTEPDTASVPSYEARIDRLEQTRLHTQMIETGLLCESLHPYPMPCKLKATINVPFPAGAENGNGVMLTAGQIGIQNALIGLRLNNYAKVKGKR
jgi:hypothetical protein